MKKFIVFFTFFIVAVSSYPAFTQDKPGGNESVQYFFSNGNGSTENPILTSVRPTEFNYSVEKQNLLTQLDQARTNDDFISSSRIQDQLNEIDGIKYLSNGYVNPVDAGMLETEQHFTANETPFYAPNYFRSTVEGGAFWSVATFSSNRTSVIFAAVTEFVSGGGDMLKVYTSYDNGINWVLKGTYNGFATTVDYRAGELDIEAITNGTDTLVFAVAGYNYNGHAFSQIAKFNIVTGIVNSTHYSAGTATNDSVSTYNPKITSDNTQYSSSVYIYLSVARDSLMPGGLKKKSLWYAYLTAPFTTFDITYRSPNNLNGFYWNSIDSSSTYLYQDIAYTRVGNTNRLYTVYNHEGFYTDKKLYLAFSDDYAATLPTGLTMIETQNVLSAKIAANGNNPNICIGYRRFFGPDWDYRCQYSVTGGDSLTNFTASYPEYTSAQSPVLIDVQSVKNADGGFVFSWVNSDSTMRYRRTNTAGLTYNTSIQVADLLKGDTRFGGSKAGYINTNSTDSSLVVWSSSNGVNAYSSYNLYTPVGVDDDENGIPLVYSLEQNYPNPFNPSTTIKFSIPEQTNVTLKIFNSIGQEVASLLNGEMAAGNHSVDFNASKLSSGVYFYRIDSPSFTSTKKMILIK